MPRSREAQARAWDRVLVAAVAALLVVGLMAVYSATAGEPGSLWQKQIVYAAIGLVLVAGLQIVPPRVFYMMAYPLYFLSLIPLLYIILFKGNSVERWIALPGGFNLQPSELTKIAFLLAMARFLSFKPVSLSAPRSLFMPFMLFIVPFILVLLQPNLSTALSFVAMTAMMAFFAGLTIRDLFFLASPLFSVILTFNNYAWAGLFIVLIAVMWRTRATLQSAAFWILANIGAGYAAIFVWNKILFAHQRGRILTFVDPAMDPQGAGYQVLQSKVAIGSGGFFGKGYLNGTQTNLSFLPEEHTDFIFSVIGEQIGFIGCLAVLGLFFLMLQRILGVAVDTRSRFTALVAVGITGIFAFHVLVNVSMTMGMMPVTGLPLPFLSYGGSFLISCLIMLGVLFNLRAHGEYL
jgi:rod shape determining protein RodA